MGVIKEDNVFVTSGVNCPFEIKYVLFAGHISYLANSAENLNKLISKFM